MAKIQKEYPLTDAQRDILLEHVSQTPHKLPRYKAQTILGANAGATSEQMAPMFGRTKETLDDWLGQWEKMGPLCLFSGHIENTNSMKLEDDQWEKVYKTLQGSPSDVELPEQLWTVPVLANWMFSEFGVKYNSDRSYHYCLHLAGLSFKYPTKFDVRRDEGKIEARMAEIRTEVAELAKDPDTIIFASDEVKVQEETETRKGWLRTGEKTVIKIKRNGKKQSYTGFLNLATGKCTVEELAWQNTATTIPALQNLLAANPNKKVVVIWDNASWHRSQALKDELGPGNSLENLYLIQLPPYAPDHNPIEHVWNAAKGESANILQRKFADTKARFVSYITESTFQYKL